jgi:hypothetical protein
MKVTGRNMQQSTRAVTPNTGLRNTLPPARPASTSISQKSRGGATGFAGTTNALMATTVPSVRVFYPSDMGPHGRKFFHQMLIAPVHMYIAVICGPPGRHPARTSADPARRSDAMTGATVRGWPPRTWPKNPLPCYPPHAYQFLNVHKAVFKNIFCTSPEPWAQPMSTITETACR